MFLEERIILTNWKLIKGNIRLQSSSSSSVVVTDGLHAYKEAFKKEFFTLKGPRTQHLSSAGMRGRVNNPVERLHGTKRERDKVLRSLKRMTHLLQLCETTSRDKW